MARISRAVSVSCLTFSALGILLSTVRLHAAESQPYRFGYDARADFVAFDPHFRDLHESPPFLICS
jgi:hypothetical protein